MQVVNAGVIVLDEKC